MLSYLIQVIAFQLLFLMGYELLLKRETFFTYNRWYLLSTSIIALLLPLIKIEGLSFLVPQETISNLSTVWLPEIFIGEQQQFSETLPAVQITAQTKELNFWTILYFFGFFGSLFVLLRKYQHLSSLFRFKVISEKKEFRIIEVPDSNIACTFYKTILLGDQLSEGERSQILSHELIHVKQMHSLDLIYFEVLKIVFWFNPLIHIYQNKIATVHEFIADEAVVKNTGKLNYYEQLLNSAFSTRNISFINQFFNHSLTRLTVFGKTITFGSSGGQVKKRIVMLQRSKSKTIAKIKYLVILPLMLVMLTYVACSDDKLSSSSDLEKYNYTLRGGEEKASEKNAESYHNFLDENSDYVGWRIVDHEKETIEYSIHSKDEEVPKDYKQYQYLSSNGENRLHYIKEINTDANTTIDNQEIHKILDKEGALPFAVIEQVPIFPGCENLGSNEAQKDCMSQKIQEYVQKNFNTSLGKELNLTGINRVIVQFKIDKNGNVAEVRSRAPHSALEEEAERVINSLPTMEPGKQNGHEVGVMYSLPIVFQVGE